MATPPTDLSSSKRVGYRRVDTAARVARLLQRIASNEIEKFQHAKLFAFPFFVEEDLLRKINTDVDNYIAEIPISAPTEFYSSTRFQDMSTLRFDRFDDFIRNAGDKYDPERTILRWNKFSLDDTGEVVAGEVTITLTTEKRLDVQDTPVGEFNQANIELTVSGSDHDWVEKCFNGITPYILTARLGWIYRPLWIFRRHWFVNISSHVISWIGFITGMHLATLFLRREVKLSKLEILDKIISEREIGEKINGIARQILVGYEESWWEPIIVIGFGALTYAIIYFTAMSILPRLTPNSSIAIGLSKKRAKEYLNAFKFVVFSVILLGIIFPVLRELIKIWFS